ncbi:MAG: GH3 auxin-responsive promoter family protein, partial [Oscillospiraceae bacterium]|nr:GH3 auxin-responsive promoter family protein [Oscillospiraceae bacterium]
GKDEEEQLANRFEEALCNGNVSVAPLIASGALGHCEVRLLRRGTYDEYRQMLKDEGANLNQIKPVKVIDTDKKKAFFFNHTI